MMSFEEDKEEKAEKQEFKQMVFKFNIDQYKLIKKILDDTNEITLEDIPGIVMNISYKERFIDLENLDQYSSLFNILGNMSSILNFECFCGLDCFEEHLCTYKRGKQDSLSTILRGSNDKLDKSFAQDILTFLSKLVNVILQVT